MSKCIVIRADAAPDMGTGHAMRCLALAQWARRAGVAATLMGRIAVPWVTERLRKDGLPFIPLDGAVSAKEEPEKLLDHIQTAPRADWVVLDGYHFDAQCQKAVRHAGYKLLLIDDYAHLPEYFCDILLNQNLGAERLSYAGDVGAFLLGPRYALLRPEFTEARKRAFARILPPEPRTLLLTLGGGNCIEYLRRIAPCFIMPELAGRTLRIVRGSMDAVAIHAALHGCPADIEVLHQVDDMPSLFLETDLCITAGGSTCWELCCLGIPFLTVAVAENQRALVAALETSGVAPVFTGESFASVLKINGAEQSHGLLKFVDGGGCQRVLAEGPLISGFSLRKAGPGDCMAVLHLANAPEIRAQSLSEEVIAENDHRVWYNRRIAAPEPFFLIFYGGRLAGYVRFESEGDESSLVVSIALAREWRGMGIGRYFLKKSCKLALRKSGMKSIIAWIKPENTASRRMFTNAGYVDCGLLQHKGMLLACYRFSAREDAS